MWLLTLIYAKRLTTRDSKPIDENEVAVVQAPPAQAPAPPPSPAVRRPPANPALARATPPAAPRPSQPRVPLGEITPEPDLFDMFRDDDDNLPRRRKVPMARTPDAGPSTSASGGRSAGGTIGRSRFFDDEAGKERRGNKVGQIGRELGLSPHREGPAVLSDGDDEEVVHRMIGSPGGGGGSSDYDWGGFDEEELAATLDRTEREAFAGAEPATSSSVGGSSSTAATRATGAGTGAVPRNEDDPETEEEEQDENDPIYISDADDKENVPVPTRRVRRRYEIADDDEVIEISD